MTLSRLVLTLCALLLIGCKNTDLPEDLPSIFVEAPPDMGSAMKQEVVLPVSKIGITVLTKPLVLAEEVLGTRVIMAGEADLRQKFLLVQLDRKSASDVMNYTREVLGKGRHFVLVVNDTAVGLMPIDQLITDGNLMFHVEKKGLTNEEAVQEFDRRLSTAALKIRKIKEEERK